MLNQFWIKIKKDGSATNRTYDLLFRIAVAQARLNLSDEINEEIIIQTMNSLSLMWSQYGKIVRAISSPREFASQVFYQTLNVTFTSYDCLTLTKNWQYQDPTLLFANSKRLSYICI
jgi:hypothetical protein